LTPDRSVLRADGQDLCYVLVEAVDKAGTVHPLAMHDIRFTLRGPATLAGVANGDHHFPAEFVTDHVRLFYGKAIAVLRMDQGKGGRIEFEATSPGLRGARSVVQSR
jgi:beta-galactosidase